MTNEEMTKAFMDSINELPPLMRYPMLLSIAGMVAKALPEAEDLYREEAERVLSEFSYICFRNDIEYGRSSDEE